MAIIRLAAAWVVILEPGVRGTLKTLIGLSLVVELIVARKVPSPIPIPIIEMIHTRRGISQPLRFPLERWIVSRLFLGLVFLKVRISYLFTPARIGIAHPSIIFAVSSMAAKAIIIGPNRGDGQDS